MKPLLFLPSPRDIPEVKQAVDKLKIDKLWFKYYPQEEAYTQGREWFLEHKEYTHLVILPDDLIVEQKHLRQLDHGCENPNIISAWCNNTAGPTDDVYTDFSLTLPPMQTSSFELYNFLPIAEIPKGEPIIQVLHQGTALTFLHRMVVEKIPFRTEFPPDLSLSHDLYNAGIPQYVDLRVRCLHLRHPHGIMVGKKQREIIFEANTK